MVGPKPEIAANFFKDKTIVKTQVGRVGGEIFLAQVKPPKHRIGGGFIEQLKFGAGNIGHIITFSFINISIVQAQV